MDSSLTSSKTPDAMRGSSQPTAAPATVHFNATPSSTERGDDTSHCPSYDGASSTTSSSAAAAAVAVATVTEVVDHLCLGADRDAQWRVLEPYLHPFEADRNAYRAASRYSRPVIVYLDAILWQELIRRLGVQGALDVMLLFGCAPFPRVDDESVSQWLDASTMPPPSLTTTTTTTAAATATTEGFVSTQREVRFRVLMYDNNPLPKVVTFDESLQFAAESGGSGGMGIPATSFSSTSGPSNTLTTATNTTQNSSTHVAAGTTSPPASASSSIDRIRDLENEVRELTKQLRLLKSREVTGGGGGGPTAAATTAATSVLTAAGPTNASGVDSPVPAQHTALSAARGASPAGSHYSTLSTSGMGGQQLSNNASVLSTGGGGGPVASLSPPVPQIILPHSKSLVASTTGGSIVCIPVNYLDPDVAPYVVGLSIANGLQLVPCSIVEHRFVMFVAPPHVRGSIAVSILCTREGSLRRYAKGVWMEYRPPEDSRTVLSYHAVNQLVQEVPLPSSATLGEPSENATTDYKSEEDNNVEDHDDEDDDEDHDDDDEVDGEDDEARRGDESGVGGGEQDELLEDGASDMCSVVTTATNTNQSVDGGVLIGGGVASLLARGSIGGGGGGGGALSVGGGMGPPQHLPLTKEMLEMIQPYSVFGGPPGPLVPRHHHHRAAAGSESRPSGCESGGVGSDCSENGDVTTCSGSAVVPSRLLMQTGAAVLPPPAAAKGASKLATQHPQQGGGGGPTVLFAVGASSPDFSGGAEVGGAQASNKRRSSLKRLLAVGAATAASVSSATSSKVGGIDPAGGAMGSGGGAVRVIQDRGSLAQLQDDDVGEDVGLQSIHVVAGSNVELVTVSLSSVTSDTATAVTDASS